jgi:hypothetical protein
MSLPGWWLRVSVRLYAGLLIVYPRTFRETYGREMVLLFRDCNRDAVRRGGLRGLPALWGRTLGDLACSGWRERVDAATHPAVPREERSLIMPEPTQIERWLPYPLILLLGLGVGYLNLHTDETPFIALPLLAAAALIGFINPRAAWRWGLLLGVCPALSALWAAAIQMKLPYPNNPGELQGALIGGLIFALAGAYLGVLGRWIMRHLLPTPDTPREHRG